MAGGGENRFTRGGVMRPEMVDISGEEEEGGARGSPSSSLSSGDYLDAAAALMSMTTVPP